MLPRFSSVFGNISRAPYSKMPINFPGHLDLKILHTKKQTLTFLGLNTKIKSVLIFESFAFWSISREAPALS